MLTPIRYLVTADPDKCVGCGVCELICSLEKEKMFNPLTSRIRVVRLHPLVNLSTTCMLCEDAPCVAACPQKALEQRSDGVILIKEDKCVVGQGCSWCMQACDFGAIMLHPEKQVVVICDLCEGDPKCVKWCPEEALAITSLDALARKLEDFQKKIQISIGT